MGANGTDNDTRLLQTTLFESSWQRDQSGRTLEIISTIDSPPLRWYLRGFENVTYAESIPPGTISQAVITDFDVVPALDGAYGRADFDYRSLQTIQNTQNLDLTFIQRLRGWYFADSSIPEVKERVTVWLRAE